MENWEWPQYTVATLYVIGVLLESWLHGQERTGKFNGPIKIIGSAIGAWILYCGGFWS